MAKLHSRKKSTQFLVVVLLGMNTPVAAKEYFLLQPVEFIQHDEQIGQSAADLVAVPSLNQRTYHFKSTYYDVDWEGDAEVEGVYVRGPGVYEGATVRIYPYQPLGGVNRTFDGNPKIGWNYTFHGIGGGPTTYDYYEHISPLEQFVTILEPLPVEDMPPGIPTVPLFYRVSPVTPLPSSFTSWTVLEAGATWGGDLSAWERGENETDHIDEVLVTFDEQQEAIVVMTLSPEYETTVEGQQASQVDLQHPDDFLSADLTGQFGDIRDWSQLQAEQEGDVSQSLLDWQNSYDFGYQDDGTPKNFTYSIPMPNGTSWQADFAPMMLDDSAHTEADQGGLQSPNHWSYRVPLQTAREICRNLMLVYLYYGLGAKVLAALTVA